MGALACTSEAPPSHGPDTGSTGHAGPGTTTSGGVDVASAGGTQAAPTTEASSSEEGSEAGSSTGGSGGDALDDNGCPADAPGSWVACESFETITDPLTQLSQWNAVADGFAVESGAGVDGGRGLRVRLLPGIMFGGWVTLRFGEGPAAPAVDSPEGRWDELWVRHRLRTSAGWPGRPIGDVGELIAMNGANWGIAADLNLHGEGPMRIAARGWSCIVDGELACDGRNDWAGVLQNISSGEGTTVVFDAGHADAWVCIEAHMRLNSPGVADGEAHVWVDGVAEIELLGIDWRETWDDFGINAVRFTNYAEPVDAPLDFVIDDVVVATARVGCE